MNIDEKLKEYHKPKDICETLFNTYSDILQKARINENQIITLIQKIIDNNNKISAKAVPPKGTLNPINSFEVYPKSSISPDKKLEDNYFSKSNQNFFNNNVKSTNINFVDQNFNDEKSLKHQLEEINNNRKSKYLDEEKRRL
jgi:hypothetical protein